MINKIGAIHFDSTEEIHTLGHLYESMLKEMRDAAGDSGEFYTPRSVVRLMVEVTNPRLGETILDPACGTGGFAPYTSIPTNLLFFDRTGPTTHVWFYEQPLPEGRRQYTKTQPLQYEEFADCVKWWGKRKESDRAWRIPAKQILDNNCNLDIKNPNTRTDFEHLPPEQLADDILKKELRIAEIMREIKELLGRKP